MKKIVVFPLFFLSTFIFSQHVRIKAKIEYQKERNYLMPKVYGDSIYMPYLKLIYQNNSDRNYYFYAPFYEDTPASNAPVPTYSKKINDTVYSIASVYYPRSFNEEVLDLLLTKKRYPQKDTLIFNTAYFTFEMKNFNESMNYNGLNILFENQSILNRYRKQYKYFEYPNYEVIDFNYLIKIIGKENYYKEQQHLQRKYLKGTFNHNLSPRYIRKSDQFIFLKKRGGRYVRKIDLGIFFYLKTSIFIRFPKISLESNLIILDDKDNKVMGILPEKFHEQSLPKKIGCYYLYEGNISGDSVWLDLTKK